MIFFQERIKNWIKNKEEEKIKNKEEEKNKNWRTWLNFQVENVIVYQEKEDDSEDAKVNVKIFVEFEKFDQVKGTQLY